MCVKRVIRSVHVRRSPIFAKLARREYENVCYLCVRPSLLPHQNSQNMFVQFYINSLHNKVPSAQAEEKDIVLRWYKYELYPPENALQHLITREKTRLPQLRNKKNKLILGDDNKEIMIEELKPSSYQNIPPQHAYQPIYYELSNIVKNNQSTSTTCIQQLQSSDSSSNNNLINPCNQNFYHIDKRHQNLHRKRKTSYYEANSDFEETEETKSVKSYHENKRQNHSEIEKRRRDKMNTYILELSSMVPMCHTMSRKLDKLTVLRMAVQHLKSIRRDLPSYSEGNLKSSILSNQELKNLVLQIADGFLFVVGCERGQLMFVSESVTKYLNYDQGDLLGQSLFDIIHPKDVVKVKEQLSNCDLNPRERLIDAKTMLPVKTDLQHDPSRLYPGARRSFFCRMKYNFSKEVKMEADTTTGCYERNNLERADKKFCVIHCTGYLKAWTSTKMGFIDETEADDSNFSCLVTVGRILPHISTIAQTNLKVKPIHFVSRHAIDGKFVFVDQRATLVLGYLPQELLGTNMYEYFHHDDINFIADYHKIALQTGNKITTKIYRFKTKDGSYIKLESEWKIFKNPWTKEIDNLISKNKLIWTDDRIVDSSACKKTQSFHQDCPLLGCGKEMQRIISNQVEASKIGRKIAEQMVDLQKNIISSVGSSESNEEVSINNPWTKETCISTNIPTPQSVSQIQEQEHLSNESVIDSVSSNSANNVEISEPLKIGQNNDEAAMAALLSLYDIDTGLVGPIDFSELPWPLS